MHYKEKAMRFDDLLVVKVKIGRIRRRSGAGRRYI